MSNNRTRFFFFTERTALSATSLFLGCLALVAQLCVADGARAQSVGNKFVSAETRGGAGILVIYSGNPPRPNQTLSNLSQPGSYLTVRVQGKYYSNNPFGAKIGNGLLHAVDVQLDNGRTSVVRDTLRTVWAEDGFDIVQDAYPVAFTISGAIVLSVKIVNHTGTPFINVQGQYLMDNDVKNDNSAVIHEYGYLQGQWLDTPPNLPSFYLTSQNPPDSVNMGLVAVGYLNDSFPPRPLGLTPPVLLEFGDWFDQGNYTWGAPPLSDRSHNPISDIATLMMWPAVNANSFVAGSDDSVTQIFRTAYGTPEWCLDHGSIVGIALYPHHLYWDNNTNTYSPNPFQVQAFLFNVSQNVASNVKIRQTINDPVRIKSPKPTGLPRDTTQEQALGSISTGKGGFKIIHWTDSVIVSPSGCAASYPINMLFDVTVNGTSLYNPPWMCSIDVECPHPDTIAPSFENAYVGCNPQMYDTAVIQENNNFDLGLQNISISSPDLNPGDYAVTLNPAPPYGCTMTPVKAFVHQVDTFKAGRVILTHTDCAGNISRDTICFTAHPPLPDKTSPIFVPLAQNTDCHARCTDWVITDSTISITSIDRGVGSVVITPTNMTVTGKTGTVAPSLKVDTLHICVIDTMLDGAVTIQATDTSNNTSTQTITYCTTPDTKAPLVAQSAFNTTTNSYHLHVTDTTGWDRGIDSVWIENGANVSAISLPTTLACILSFDFDLKVVDTSKCAHGTIKTRDCKGNISTPLVINYSKSSSPAVTADKTVLCTPSDVATLTVAGSFATYNWSSPTDANFNATGKSITVSKAGSYVVNVDDGIGCTASSTPLVISFSPATPQVAPAGPITLCAPDSVELDAGAGFATYAWSDGTNPAGKTQKIWVKSSGNYSASVTNAAGCVGTSPSVVVTINPKPAQPVITESSGTLSTTATAKQYQWLDSAKKSIAGQTSASFTPTQGGTYYVMVTDANGCSNTSLPFTNAGSTLISVGSAKAAQGSHVSIPLTIETQSGLAPNVTRTWHVKLRFNKTLLIPTEKPITSVISGSDRTIEYSESTQMTQGVIKQLPFTAALGNDSCTDITIDSFWWTPGLTVTKKDGQFCLTDLCYQGGTRLFNSDGKFSLSAPHPSPANNSVTIDYSIIEAGHTTLVVNDLLGREVMRLVDADQQPGSYTVTANTSALAGGTYIYSLRTPTLVESRHLQIAR